MIRAKGKRKTRTCKGRQVAGLNRVIRIGLHKARDSNCTYMMQHPVIDADEESKTLYDNSTFQTRSGPQTLRKSHLTPAFCIHGAVATLLAGDPCSALSVWFA